MWGILKDLLVEVTGTSKDALHVHVGLIAFFATMFLLRRPMASLLPWLVVLVLEVGNEYLDLFVMRSRPPEVTHWGESLRDVINTMLWPTIMVLFAHARRRREDVEGRLPLRFGLF